MILPNLMFAILGAAANTSITLSNTHLPLDATGRPIITGETSVLPHPEKDGFFLYYVNLWGSCPSVDCCPSPDGCASCCYVPSTSAYNDTCVFADHHTVYVYETNLTYWSEPVAVLPPSARTPGIEFRPHVVFAQGKYVMWFENRPAPIASSGYAVATSLSPKGPFHVLHAKVAVADVPGDFDILLDEDGRCWHVQTTTNDPHATKGFVVTQLNGGCTSPAHPIKSAKFEAPLPAEGPVFFKRKNYYYILGGTTCCACRGGSSIYVFRSQAPLGPWSYVGDIGSVTGHVFDKHDPNNYVTRAQASAVFSVGNDQYLWLGNQWVTSGRRDSSLLYWFVLDWNDKDEPSQVQRSNTTSVMLISQLE